MQFQSTTNSDVMNLNQMQSQLNSNISFMRDSIVENKLQHKEPAVVAAASVHNYSYHHQYGVQTISFGPNRKLYSEFIFKS